MGYWRTYCEWIGGQTINMLTRAGKVEEMEIVINDYLIYSTMNFLRFLIIKKTSSKTFDSFTVHQNEKEASLEEKNLKRFFDYMKEEQFKDFKSVHEGPNQDLDDDQLELMYMKSQTRVFETHRGSLSMVNPRQGQVVLGKSLFGMEWQEAESTPVKEANEGWGDPKGSYAEALESSDNRALMGSTARGLRSSRQRRLLGDQNLPFEVEAQLVSKQRGGEPGLKSHYLNYSMILEEEESKFSNRLQGNSSLRNSQNSRFRNLEKSPGFPKAKKSPQNQSINKKNQILKKGDNSNFEIENSFKRVTKRRSTQTKSKSTETLENQDSKPPELGYSSMTSEKPEDLSNLHNHGNNRQSGTRRSKKSQAMGILNIKKLTRKSELSSSGGSVNALRIKSRAIEKIVKKYYKPEETTQLFRFLQISLFVFLALNMLAVYLKEPMQTLTNQDIITQAVNVDVFSWEIWSYIYTAGFLSTCRMVESGFMDNEMNIADYNTTIFKSCHRNFQRSITYHVPPDNMIEKSMKNLTFPYLYRYEDFMKMKVNLEVYDVDYRTGVVSWRNLSIGRKSAVHFMHQMSIPALKRDYENSSGIVPKTGRNRDLDPDEDFFRRNGIGDLHQQYSYRSYDFYEYMHSVAYQNQLFIFYSSVTAIVFSVMMYLVFMVCISREIYWMRNFYRKLFSLEVSLSGLKSMVFRCKRVY